VVTINLKNKSFILLVGIVIFYVVFISISDINKFFNIMNSINLLLLPLILIIHICALVVRALRQKIILDSLGLKISTKDNIKIHIASLSMIMTPLASGEMIKSYFLKKKYDHSYDKTIPSVLFEKYQDLLAITSILLVLSCFSYLRESEIAISIFIIILIIGFLLLKNKKFLPLFSSKLPKKWIIKTLVEEIDNYQESFHLLLGKKTFLKSWIVGILSWALDAVVVYLVFLSLNVNYSFAYSNLITYTAVIAGALSFIPGGMGITEASMTGLLMKSGLGLSTSTAITIMVRLATIWFTTILGMIVIKFATRK
jgi:glycosyltransferase 2 family protein